MKKQSTIIIIGILAIGGYFAFKKGLFGKKSEEPGTETETDESKAETKEGEPGTEKESAPGKPGAPATIIDTTRGNITVPQAIEQAKSIVEAVKSAKVLIKTKRGNSNILVKGKSAKKSDRMAKRKAKQTAPKTRHEKRHAKL